ncbi:unnamed protein product, partial [Staurois parvus]
PGPCIHYIRSLQTLHSLDPGLPPDPAFTRSPLHGPRNSLYPVSPNPAFTISGLPGPAFTISALPGPHIHFIRSPRTLHSLYPLSPGPCIHYIRYPRPLHPLYPLSPDLAFTI